MLLLYLMISDDIYNLPKSNGSSFSPELFSWGFQFTIFKQPCVDIIRYILSYPMNPSTFLGSVWGMIWRVKYLLRQCLDP